MKFLVTIFVVLNCIHAVVLGLGVSQLVLHLKHENRSITLKGDECNGAILHENVEVSCVCATGLWLFYKEKCESSHAILGATNGQCFNLDLEIGKVSLLSPIHETPSSSSAVPFDPFLTTQVEKYVSEKQTPPKTHFVSAGFPVLITTGSQSWRIPEENMCLKPFSLDSSVPNFCIFQHSVLSEYRLIDEDCSVYDDIISPLICNPYLNSDSEATSCSDWTSRRVRRDADDTTSPVGPGSVFTKTVLGLTNDSFPVIPPGDENEGLVGSTDRPYVNDELWRFVTMRAQIRLGIRQAKGVDKTSIAYSPAFEFLEVAKQIQQKACPEFYVTKEHYDVAIGTFESLQRNLLKYVNPYTDYATSERILDALNQCLNNVTTYPFLEWVGQAGVSCNGSEPIEHGSYEMFGKILHLNLGQDQSSRHNEPVIETAWKVFVHAHSACFPYFANNYNDHHQFTTIMLDVFTNDINDLWFSVPEVQPDIYEGFLGDAVELLDSVAYCAMFSRLDSEYPWDLPRPKKDNAKRRKRDVSEGYSGFDCLDERHPGQVCSMPKSSSLPSGQIGGQEGILEENESINEVARDIEFLKIRDPEI